MIKQLINAVSQFLQMRRNITIKFIPWAYMYTTLKCSGKGEIQTNPSKFDERLFSHIYLCRLRLKQGREIHERVSERGTSVSQTGRQTDKNKKQTKQTNKKTARDIETEKLYIPQGLNLGNFTLSVEHSKHNIQTE